MLATTYLLSMGRRPGRRRLGAAAVVAAGLLTLLAAATATVAPAAAQTNVAGVELEGLGRAIVSTESLTGNLVAGDTTSAQRATGGYTLFDLGVTARPNETTEARAILRLRNELGGFFGDGSFFSLRELYVRGAVADVVDYTIGDMDAELTPYTLYNSARVERRQEARIFALRRDIVDYENFYRGTTWRVQGVRAGTAALFDRGVRRVELKSLLVRTRTSPDRLLAGARMVVQQSGYLRLGATYANLFEVAQSTAASETPLRNPVLTGDVLAGLALDDAWRLGVRGEGGFSRTRFDATPIAYDDFFFDATAFAEYEPLALRASVAYRDVGPQFFSPGAQTRRLNQNRDPARFPTSTNIEGVRRLALYDALTQERIYNNEIRPALLGFDPRVDPVTPYGRATPNRRGASVRVSRAEVGTDAVYAEAGADLVQEIVGEGTPATRRYAVGLARAEAPLGARLGLERALRLRLGARYTRTTRDATTTFANPPDGGPADDGVDLTTLLVNAGLTVGLLDRLELLLGAKVLTADGDDFLAERDAFYRIVSFQPVRTNDTETLFAGGFRYEVFDGSFLIAQVQTFGLVNDHAAARDFRISEVFLHYVLRF